jgi:hypothetical protein
MAAIRRPAQRWVHRELSDKGEFYELGADREGLLDVYGPTSATTEGQALLDEFRLRTTLLFGGDTSRSSAEIPEEQRKLLEQLGYLEQ